MLLETLIQENEFIALENEISERVHDSFERQQRRVFLHERLRVLQDELGEEGEDDTDRGMYMKQLEGKKLPEAAATALTKEIKRLSDLPPLSAEVAVAKTYLDIALSLPWGARSASSIPDVAAVARVLDETHYGLKSVKDRIIEYLAVASLRGGTPPNAILCLVGPPGVGKTSVATGHGQRAGPADAAHQSRRRARRGRGPGAPQDLRGRHAGPHHRRAQTGRGG